MMKDDAFSEKLPVLAANPETFYEPHNGQESVMETRPKC